MSDKTKETKHSIRTLHSDPDNPREISSEGLAGLTISTGEYGDLSGIVYNRRTGELVCGHQRVKSLRLGGAGEWVEVSSEEGYILHAQSGERFKVRIVDWDEGKQRAANIVANNPKIQGTFTGEVLGQLRQLEETNENFEALQLGVLAAQLEQDLAKQRKRAEKELEKASDESDDIGEAFDIIIECTGEEQQRELLEELMKRGIKCRALI